MDSALTGLRSSLEMARYPTGVSNMAISYATVHNFNKDTVLKEVTEDNFAYLVIEGAVRLTLPTSIVELMPGQYFLSSSIKGIASHALAVAASAGHLGLRFDFTTDDVVAVLLDIDVNFTGAVLEKSASPTFVPQNQPDLVDLARRVVQTSQRSDNGIFLAKHLKRELIYLIVTGPHGNALVQDVLRIRNAKDIYLANDWIRSNYKSDFVVDDLAELTHMSVSSFHRKFKTAIGMGPLQCQKQLRLVEAKRLMLDEAFSVTEVAMEVGYESLSQFSRDYRNMFGLSPQKDISNLREQSAEKKT